MNNDNIETIPERIGKRIECLGNTTTSTDHLYYKIIKIGPITEKSPVDLRRIAVIQTLVRNHHLTLWRKLSQ